MTIKSRVMLYKEQKEEEEVMRCFSRGDDGKDDHRQQMFTTNELGGR